MLKLPKRSNQPTSTFEYTLKGRNKFMTNKITRQEIQEKLNRGDALILVDALQASTYEQGHLPGALNIPHAQVEETRTKASLR